MMLGSHKSCCSIEGTRKWVVVIASTALSITQPMQLASMSLPQKQKPTRFIQASFGRRELNEMEWKEYNFRIFFPSLIWEF